ncbi:hypothetical protein PQR63_02050 [Herbaspirillum rhizosphaerae]|uniref:Hydroxyethylthiazole kinase n=1 Tax=Herbaspirillum rhizosphaerae TaxID=346179 RepID=A0ABW8Z212_9BURK
MIISSPLLLPPEELPHYGTDDAMLEAAMLPTASRLVGGTGAAEGTFPVSNHLMWHNGVHLQAQDKGSHVLSLRAIADGEIIFLSRPTPDSADPQHGQNYDEGWTDNGCIILRHNTEIGADGNHPVSVTYYSVYMHVEKFIGGLEEGKKIYRKDVLGGAGLVYGHKKQVHFEICCDTTNLQKIIGRAPRWQDPQQPPAKDGRTDSVFGNLYIYLPATTPVSSAAPTDHLRHDTGSTLGTAQWIELDYGDEGATPGSCALTSYSNKGDYGNTRKDHDAEYNLYKEATERHNMVVKAHPAAKSSPSGWYELLRFGRNLGRSAIDKDPLPDNAAHWRKIKTIDGKEVWTDLNAPGTYKFSDADFLPQFGWNCYDDDSNPNDQRCDSPKLKALLRAQGDQPDPDRNKDDVKLSKRLGDKDVARALRRTICKFPSEWDRTTISQRYHWLNEMEYGFKDHPDDWKRFENHLKAITFEKLPQAYLDAQWHFHPTEFIQLFRKCGWLSKEELAQIYDEKKYASLEKTSSEYKERYRSAMNIVLRKYALNTPTRSSHFFGQCAIESFYMMIVRESAIGIATAVKTNHVSIMPEVNGNLRSPPAAPADVAYFSKYEGMTRLGNTDVGDGIKFRGRGFKQLTGRYNYSMYWIFRGWLSGNDYDHTWFTKDKHGLTRPGPKIEHPEIVGNDPYSCTDTAGFFCASNRIAKAADAGVTASASYAVTKIVNAYDTKSPPLRWHETQEAHKILGDIL